MNNNNKILKRNIGSPKKEHNAMMQRELEQGERLFQEGRAREAESFFLRAIEIDPDNEKVQLNLALLYQKMKRWKEAAGLLEQIIARDEKNVELLNQLALAYMESGDQTKMIRTLQRSLAINPDQPEIAGVLKSVNAADTVTHENWNTAPSDISGMQASENKSSDVINRPQGDQKAVHVNYNNAQGKILHIMISSAFIPSYITFVRKHFGSADHRFVFIEKENYAFGLTPEHGVEFINTVDGVFITIKDYMETADKIILHGLWRTEVDILLYFNQYLLEKCYWVMWGGDFYFPERHTEIKKQVIKNMGHAITDNDGDYELAKTWYNTRAKQYKCFSYISNTYKDYSYLQGESCNYGDKKVILMGNSADPTNNHFEILNYISGFRGCEIEVICPLSYGNNDYSKKVIQAGNAIFGERFIPITSFMPLEEYVKILLKTSVAIFAHKRQQGMGNIIKLLGLGKKVYIRDDITTWKLFNSINVKVFSFNNEKIDFTFPDHVKNNNMNEIKEYFSYNRLVSDWKKIFGDNHFESESHTFQ